ncbi:MAG: PEP-utilizing enzyme [Patescibacteria group bacterium]
MSLFITSDSIKSKKWYRQQTEATPYFIYLPCRGVVDYFKNKKEIIWYCSLDEARGYLEQNYIRELAEKHLAAEKHRPGFSKKLYVGFRRDIQEKDQRLFQAIDGIDLTKISDQKLLAFNRSLGRQAYAMWLKFFMDIFDVDAESLIERELIREKKTLTAEEKNLLTTSTQPLANQEQELELLKIVKLVKDDPDCVYLLNRIQSADNIHRLMLHPRLLHGLEAYIKKYHWIRNSWAHVNFLNVFDVVDQIKQIVSGSRDIDAEIKQLENYSQELTSRKRIISKKHHLSNWLVRMFEMFGFLAFWRDSRKVQMQQLHYYLQLVGTEIARRSQLSWDKIKFCDPLSIQTIPVKSLVLARCYKFHKNSRLMYWDGRVTRHFDPASSKKLVAALESTFSTEMTEIRGLIACPGKIKGEVVVINKKSEFRKMMPGKILVTTMTRPDFLPLMRQAAAVVTDEGGITSHAAIVSRELKIPCIIGTQVGTKVLKDGYQVEVNANHGVVLVLDSKDRPHRQK